MSNPVSASLGAPIVQEAGVNRPISAQAIGGTHIQVRTPPSARDRLTQACHRLSPSELAHKAERYWTPKVDAALCCAACVLAFGAAIAFGALGFQVYVLVLIVIGLALLMNIMKAFNITTPDDLQFLPH